MQIGTIGRDASPAAASSTPRADFLSETARFCYPRPILAAPVSGSYFVRLAGDCDETGRAWRPRLRSLLAAGRGRDFRDCLLSAPEGRLEKWLQQSLETAFFINGLSGSRPLVPEHTRRIGRYVGCTNGATSGRLGIAGLSMAWITCSQGSTLDFGHVVLQWSKRRWATGSRSTATRKPTGVSSDDRKRPRADPVTIAVSGVPAPVRAVETRRAEL